MSGPKISVYALDAKSQKIVYGQMRCEQQSVLCAQQVRELIHRVRSYCEEVRKQQSLLDILERRNGSDAAQQDELQNVLKRINTETQQVETSLAGNMPKISAKYTITEEALKEKKQELDKVRELRKKLKTLQEEIDTIVGSKSEDAQIASEKIKKSIAEDIGGDVSFDIPLTDDMPDTEFEDSKAEVQNKLVSLLKTYELPENIAEDIKNAIISLDKIQQLEYLRSFESVTVKNIIRKIDAFKCELESNRTEFNEAYARYQLLCSMAGESSNIYEYSEKAFTEVEKEIERLEKIAVKAQEQSYISECVDQVMSEMGYDLIGSREVIKKKTGKRFRNELFTFNEGTAVNVTYSSDGQISMELGGLAHEDRIPNQEETEILTKDMQTFCGEFAEFERRLKEKGILVNQRIALSPPSADYAAIINVSDYDVTAESRITEIRPAVQRKKTSDKKIMRSTGE